MLRCEEKGALLIAGGNANMHSYENQYRNSSSEIWELIYLKNCFTIPDHIPKDVLSYHKDPCSSMFIAALF